MPADHTETTEAYTYAAEGGQPRVVNRYRHKDGSVRWISWSAAPAGQMTYATGRDITAEKEQSQALEATAEALRQSQKMEPWAAHRRRRARLQQPADHHPLVGGLPASAEPP